MLLQAAEHTVVFVSHLSQVHLAWQDGGISWLGDDAWRNYTPDNSSHCTVKQCKSAFTPQFSHSSVQ